MLFFGDSHVAGIGGNTSIDVTRWQIEGKARLRTMMESRLVFSFGVNDTTLEDGSTEWEPSSSLEALGRLLRQAEALGLPALIVGPAPRGWRDEVAADAGAPPGSAVYELVAELVLTAGWLEWLAEVN